MERFTMFGSWKRKMEQMNYHSWPMIVITLQNDSMLNSQNVFTLTHLLILILAWICSKQTVK